MEFDPFSLSSAFETITVSRKGSDVRDNRSTPSFATHVTCEQKNSSAIERHAKMSMYCFTVSCEKTDQCRKSGNMANN